MGGYIILTVDDVDPQTNHHITCIHETTGRLILTVKVKISHTVVTPNLPCHKGFMYSVFGRRSTSHCFTPMPIMAQENKHLRVFSFRYVGRPRPPFRATRAFRAFGFAS